MKTEYQVQHFLFSQVFSSPTDWEIIQSYCQKRHIRIGTFRPSYSQAGLTSEQFIKWYAHTPARGDIAMLDGCHVIISESGLEVSQICAEISTNPLKISNKAVKTADLVTLPEEEQFRLHVELSRQGLEFDRRRGILTEKYIPSINERILYHNQNEAGLGVVRSILPAENKIELYCYYSYTNKTCGYSMHEWNACTFHEFHFEPMTIVAQRRMNRELEKCGKVWYDKLHRIEPIKVKVEVGQPYWSINDKLKVVKNIERGTPTSQQRYIAGNYFQSHEEALEALCDVVELLRDRLAK